MGTPNKSQRPGQNSFKIISRSSLFMQNLPTRFFLTNQSTPRIDLPLPEELIKNILSRLNFKSIFAFLSTCRYFRSNEFGGLALLPQIAFDDLQDKAISGFFSYTLQDEESTFFRAGVALTELFEKVPNVLSVHVLTNSNEAQLKLSNVRSIILQYHESEINITDLLKFLKSFFRNQRFEHIHRLILVGIPLEKEEINVLLENSNLKVLALEPVRRKNYDKHHRAHRYLSYASFERPCNDSKTVYLTHPNDHGELIGCRNLKEIVIYCPRTTNNFNPLDTTFHVNLRSCSLRLVEVHADPEFTQKLCLHLSYTDRIDKLIWNIPDSLRGHSVLLGERGFGQFGQVYVKCPNTILLEHPDDPRQKFLVKPSDYQGTEFYFLDGTKITED